MLMILNGYIRHITPYNVALIFFVSNWHYIVIRAMPIDSIAIVSNIYKPIFFCMPHHRYDTPTFETEALYLVSDVQCLLLQYQQLL